ncbi:MAG: radical SAM protein [Dehalococcoidia bacterium]|nr:radical SAM protein [Dehalococcoidia bacterium]
MTSTSNRKEEIEAGQPESGPDEVLRQALLLLRESSEEDFRNLMSYVDGIARTRHQKMIAGWITDWLSVGNPGGPFLTRIFKGTDVNVVRNYVANMIAGLFFRDQEIFNRLRNKYGFNPPSVMLISPTMRCNYRCEGCYAGQYTADDDLPPDLFDRVIGEAEAIGIRFMPVLGGEPFVYRHLLDVFANHPRVSFQPYTNGSLITREIAERIVQLGNVAPMVSIEGYREQTDKCRGPGAFERAVRAMDILRDAGSLFGFSIRVDRSNVDYVTSDEFMDLLISKGAIYGWYFLYMPVGRNPDLSMMPTPADRNKLRIAVNHFRRTKPVIMVDFWNDGPLTAGCINGGRIFFHVNHKGDVEPCIFVHYASHNIKNCSLVEALNSPFFRGLRDMQPFSYNALRPCPIIDHPGVMRSALKRWDVYPTHEGAGKTFNELREGLDEYSREVERIYDPIWEKEYSWGEEWMKVMDHPPEKVKARKRAYQARKRRVLS